MPPVSRDIVIAALVVSLACVLLMACAIVAGPQSEAGSLMAGLALLGGIYAACAALQVASLRKISEAGCALAIAAASMALIS